VYLDPPGAGGPRAEPVPALSGQPQILFVPGSVRNDDVEGAAVGQGDAFGGAVQGFQEFDRQAVEGILPTQANTAFATAAPEHVLEDILRVHEIGEAAAAAVNMRLRVGTV